MNVMETIQQGNQLFFDNQDQYFSTTFYHPSLPIRVSLKDNSYGKDEPIEALNVSFYDRSINKMKHLKVNRTKKGAFFFAYGRRIYVNELVLH